MNLGQSRPSLSKIRSKQNEFGKIKALQATIRLNMSFFKASIDTGSHASFVHKRTADILLKSGKNVNFLPLKDLPGDTLYFDYNRKPITLHGTLLTKISSLGWKVENAKFVVTENRRRCLLGLDLQSSLRIRTVQERYQIIMEVSEATLSEDSQTWKEHFKSKYSDVFSRFGRSKNHRVHSVFKDPLVTIQENDVEYRFKSSKKWAQK